MNATHLVSPYSAPARGFPLANPAVTLSNQLPGPGLCRWNSSLAASKAVTRSLSSHAPPLDELPKMMGMEMGSSMVIVEA